MNTHKNYMMYIALSSAVFLSYQAGYASASTETAIVDSLMRSDLLTDFTMGFGAGAAVARAVCGMSTKKEISATQLGIGIAALGLGSYAKAKLSEGSIAIGFLPNESFINATIGFGIGTCLVSLYSTLKWWDKERVMREYNTLHAANETMAVQLPHLRQRVQALPGLQRELANAEADFQRRLATVPFRAEKDRMANEVSRLQDKEEMLTSLDKQYKYEIAGKKGKRRDCGFCFESESKESFVSLHCGHDNVCKACIKSTIERALRSKNIKDIACTHPDCAGSTSKGLTMNDLRAVYASDAHALLRSIVTEEIPPELRDVLDQKNEIELQMWLDTIKGGQCPTADCPFRFERDEEAQIITCPACRQRFCSHCPLRHTQELTCEQARAAQNPNEADAASEALIKDTTVPCPGCRAPVVKSKGCNHMTCGVAACRTHFCYICHEQITAPYYNWEDEVLRCSNRCRIYDPVPQNA